MELKCIATQRVLLVSLIQEKHDLKFKSKVQFLFTSNKKEMYKEWKNIDNRKIQKDQIVMIPWKF